MSLEKAMFDIGRVIGVLCILTIILFNINTYPIICWNKWIVFSNGYLICFILMGYYNNIGN